MRKAVFWICLMVSVFGLNAQVNHLTKFEFYQISIDGYTLESIQNTKGNSASLVAMFGAPVSAHNDPDGEFF